MNEGDMRFLNKYFDDDDDFDDDQVLDDEEDVKVYYEDYEDEVPGKKKASWKDVRRSKKSKPNRPIKKYDSGASAKFLIIALVIILSLSLVGFFTLFSIKNELFTQGKVGVEAVNAMYNFSNLDELENNLPKLASLTTEEIYNRIAVTDDDKALNVYLKFKKNPVKVEIIESKPGYVLYTLDSSSLSSGRLFSFSYTLNWVGKIDSVREMECIDFYKQ